MEGTNTRKNRKRRKIRTKEKSCVQQMKTKKNTHNFFKKTQQNLVKIIKCMTKFEYSYLSIRNHFYKATNGSLYFSCIQKWIIKQELLSKLKAKERKKLMQFTNKRN